MEAISVGSDPRFYFQVGKIKISEGMKCLQDLVQWYKNNLTPENAGILHESIAYLQSLQRQAQEIIKISEQNDNSRPTQNEEMLHTNLESSSCSKRKRCLNNWNNFTFVGLNGKEMTQCKQGKRQLIGTSKSGTRPLIFHLQRCPDLRNLNRVANKAKEESVMDQKLNGSDLVRRIIKYELNGIKDDVLDVYEQEKDKLQRYLDELPGRFNVTIDCLSKDNFQIMTVWFIDDSWELKKKIIQLENDTMGLGLLENMKRWFQDWNIDKRMLSIAAEKIDNGIYSIAAKYRSESKVIELKSWLDERASFPLIWNTCPYFLEQYVYKVGYKVSYSVVAIKARLLEFYIMSLRKNEFELAVKKVESMGKKVTSKPNGKFPFVSSDLLDWLMECKEAFCELERMDHEIKSIKFDWDEATFVQSFWVVLNEVSKIKLANEFFPLLLKMLKFVGSENHYIRVAVLHWKEYFDETELVFAITVILDPRFKIDFVEHFYKEFYDNEADLHFKKIIDDVTNIYIKYAKDVKKMERQYAFLQHGKEFASPKSELESYLTDSKVPPYEEFDILEWWRVNSPTYPTLARMARDFLSIPISRPSLLTHFHYSLRDEIENIYSGGLDDDLKNALVCTKVWLKDPAKIQ